MNIKGYVLANEEKLKRAAEGTPVSSGDLVGGVGYDDEALLLATYDKLGGLITKDGYKIKTGSFFDFKKNAPIAKPAPIYVVRVDGEEVEVPVGKPMPLEVRAQGVLNESRKNKAAAKKAKADADKAAKSGKGVKKGGKKAPSNEVEE